MQYLLTGFTQDSGFRTFAFEGVAADRARSAFSVRADLALARKHGIQMQELPLLCRVVLERRNEGDDRHTFAFTEEDMTLHASLVRAALELHKKKAPRRPFAAQATASASAVRPG